MEIRVRRARPSDKEPLMEFVKKVWGGHDYIPGVWDRWLHDGSGEVFVVEADGKPVGMNRVRFVEDGSGWLEGARVHPEYRGRGLATKLGESSMQAAAERGVRVFRLTSGSRNRAAHRQIAKISFKEAARFTLYEPAKAPAPRRGTAERVKARGLDEVVRLMESTKEFRLGTGVYWHEFAAASLTRETVARLVKGGAVWTEGRAVAVAKQGNEGRGAWEEVSFIGGPADDAVSLLRSILGRVKGAKERWVFLPQGSPIIHALRKAGFRRHFSLVLFERRFAKG